MVTIAASVVSAAETVMEEMCVREGRLAIATEGMAVTVVVDVMIVTDSATRGMETAGTDRIEIGDIREYEMSSFHLLVMRDQRYSYFVVNAS